MNASTNISGRIKCAKGSSIYTLHLRHHGRKYRKRGAAKDSRGKIRDQVSIDERPEIVASKIRFGDLEMDTVLGKNHNGAILTINDRATKLCWIKLLTGRESEPLAKQVIDRYSL